MAVASPFDDAAKTPTPEYTKLEGDVPAETPANSDPADWKAKVAEVFQIEQRGIERVPEDERHDTSVLNAGSMVRRLCLN
jgi:hypothetical protein